MNLNLSNSGGSGNYIRFSPQANAWSNQDGEFVLEKFVFDYENLQTGWMLIATGIFEFQPDESLGRKSAQPSPEHKRGFKAVFFNKSMGLAEFSANGAGANMGLEGLWKQVQAQAGANAGKLPVVEYTGSRPEKVGKGSTRVPEFNVTGWVARPAAMQEGAAEFVVLPTTQVPAPAAKPAPSKPAPSKPAPSLDDDEMFS
jgi:hypothetical protein